MSDLIDVLLWSLQQMACISDLTTFTAKKWIHSTVYQKLSPQELTGLFLAPAEWNSAGRKSRPVQAFHLTLSILFTSCCWHLITSSKDDLASCSWVIHSVRLPSGFPFFSSELRVWPLKYSSKLKYLQFHLPAPECVTPFMLISWIQEETYSCWNHHTPGGENVLFYSHHVPALLDPLSY